jgi:hypothetical protein
MQKKQNFLAKQISESLNIIVPVVMEQAFYRSTQIDSGRIGIEPRGNSSSGSATRSNDKLSKLKAVRVLLCIPVCSGLYQYLVELV